MNTDSVEEAAVSIGRRIIKGHLNGTTRSQGYAILATMGILGAASGVSSTVYLFKRKFILQPKFVKIPREVRTD